MGNRNFESENPVSNLKNTHEIRSFRLLFLSLSVRLFDCKFSNTQNDVFHLEYILGTWRNGLLQTKKISENYDLIKE